ncbi:hypothetical protein PCANC_17496 [Puccinia coronata f. sp. avenae]|uniref:Threonylcarbamoyl-AMP synthase C-terminal domain-containing protein n=1 Tax=Puccinia coronata f. sp. avenae TaxID=200324 RepID=A0A2N5SS67_9BASI|nr:hypothetical protein PCANC_17496 [Puccinia coronata f. sp. avenae]
MKYKYCAPHAKVVILNPFSNSTPSSDEEEPPVGSIAELVSKLCGKDGADGSSRSRLIGLMLMKGSALHQSFMHYNAHSKQDEDLELCYSNLGPESQPSLSAQRLFAALSYLDKEHAVHLILVKRLTQARLGATVMERLRKASGNSSPLSIRISSSQIQSSSRLFRFPLFAPHALFVSHVNLQYNAFVNVAVPRNQTHTTLFTPP